jgi:hypothetical protein
VGNMSHFYFIPINPTYTGLEPNQDLRDMGLENIRFSHSKASIKCYASVKYVIYTEAFSRSVYVCVENTFRNK